MKNMSQYMFEILLNPKPSIKACICKKIKGENIQAQILQIINKQKKKVPLPTILLTVLGRPFGFLGAPDTAAVLGLLTVVGLTRAVTALIG